MKHYILCDMSAILLGLALILIGGYFYCIEVREKAEKNAIHQVVKVDTKQITSSVPTMFEVRVKHTD